MLVQSVRILAISYTLLLYSFTPRPEMSASMYLSMYNQTQKQAVALQQIGNCTLHFNQNYANLAESNKETIEEPFADYSQ